jgi:hypothetical protein
MHYSSATFYVAGRGFDCISLKVKLGALPTTYCTRTLDDGDIHLHYGEIVEGEIEEDYDKLQLRYDASRYSKRGSAEMRRCKVNKKEKNNDLFL